METIKQRGMIWQEENLIGSVKCCRGDDGVWKQVGREGQVTVT